MIQLLKRLLPGDKLPAHVHFHIDDHGNEIFCDASVCRPQRPTLLLTHLR